MHSVGESIRRNRMRKKKTQAEVSRGADISQNYLSEVERGIYTPSIGTIKNIAKALGVMVATLVGE